MLSMARVFITTLTIIYIIGNEPLTWAIAAFGHIAFIEPVLSMSTMNTYSHTAKLHFENSKWKDWMITDPLSHFTIILVFAVISFWAKPWAGSDGLLIIFFLTFCLIAMKGLWSKSPYWAHTHFKNIVFAYFFILTILYISTTGSGSYLGITMAGTIKLFMINASLFVFSLFLCSLTDDGKD